MATMNYEWHPLSMAFRMMTAEEYAEFLSDIRANGLRDAVVLYQGKILDGRNRYKACQEAGIVPHFIEFVGDDEAAERFVESKNAHRRHLSVEERLDRVRKKLKADPEKSNRVIAEETKTDRETVQKERKKLEEAGEIPQTEARKGKDERKQTVKHSSDAGGGNPPVKASQDNQVSGRRKQTTKAEPLQDAVGEDVPNDLRDVFGDPWLSQLAELVDEMRTHINSPRVYGVLKGKSQAYSAFLRAGEALKLLKEADDHLEQVESIIRSGTPYAVHDECGGEGCSDCRKAGWLPKWRYDELTGVSA